MESLYHREKKDNKNPKLRIVTAGTTLITAGNKEKKRWKEIGKDLEGKLKVWENIDIGVRKSTRKNEFDPKNITLTRKKIIVVK